MRKIEKDVVIIGAGPSGLFAVFECGFLGYSCAVVDALPEIGGQLAALYPEKPIYDVPGHPEILAMGLVEKLEKQASPFKPEYVLGQSVEVLHKLEDGRFVLETKDTELTCKVVIIAGGGGMFTPRKPPGLENLQEFEEKSLFYAVKQKSQFADKHIIIAGGGDSAVDWAVELADNAKSLHVVHRRNDFRAAEETVRQMYELAEAGKIQLHTPMQLSELKGDNGQVEAVAIKDLDGNVTELPADAVLCFFGIAPNPGPFAKWDLALQGKKVAVEPITQKTNIDGVLAIGDIAAYEGKISLILVGFAEAAQAAKTAQAIIEPDKKFKVQYSTAHKPGE
ncbi:MAG: NAD(P)/FAD-dependent oxidoreductase [Alphaproteobacteria bacterium]|nr:NAD(P)/FAD-dependent oxidoreductase [Alphaproteobacteria bacterium]MDD9919606.1 NAD(P)/FAD-dependent oxidoreductase [Alphaproteobacteria bacterium]